jgi:hypothetical protein
MKRLTDIKTSDSIEKESLEGIEHPKICCLDLDSNSIKKIKQIGTNIYEGTLGARVKVNYSPTVNTKQLLLNYSLPQNLHEYDITIVDLGHFDTIEYKYEDHIRADLKEKTSIYLLSSLPQTVFDPRPFGSHILKTELEKNSSRKHLLIIFSSESYTIDYDPIEITTGTRTRLQSINHSIYSLLDYPPLAEKIYGQEIKICNIKEGFQSLLEKYFVKNSSYNQTFKHREKWVEGKYQQDENFIPLITNLNGDIISFFEVSEKLNVIIFPQINEKADFLFEFLTVVAPSFFPELFPFSTAFIWKKNEEYWLPNHSNLIELESNIKKEYESKLANCRVRIDENLLRFDFLHQIIIATGSPLVKSLIQYFSWLGYTNIKDLDELKAESKILEEDIQIEIPEGLLVIECKGIGGTSTDSDCSQISKIKHRRCKERSKFDVFALYLVNHQRYLPPQKRHNPPFTKHQIQDAKNDERGLLTTWQLFTLYFDIENGICTKEEAKKTILEYGLIDFKPKDLIYIYEPTEFFNNGKICIVNILDILLKVNDELFIEKNGRLEKFQILDIQINGKSFPKASSGELGLRFDKKIRKNSTLWKKNES